jgi:glycosyltransferase involved in cell wall biosynthesis
MHIATPPASRAAEETPLSVCYVLASFPVLSETFVSNEIRAMRELGHRILPLALAPHDGDCQPEDEPFRAETLQLRSIPPSAALRGVRAPAGLLEAVRFARAQTGLPLRSLLYAGARVAAAARDAGCTHLHAHFAHSSAATAIVAARLAGLTVSFMAHGYDVYGTPQDLPAKLAATDIALATCDDMATDFLALSPGARVQVVRCGIDPARFARPERVTQRNGRLLAVGRLVEQKGYDILLHALAALPPDRRPVIDAVGGGPLRTELEEAALTLGVAASINFLGALPNRWVADHGPDYLGFVAPYRITSNGDRDTSPMVLKEAMAMELPVVASALMGMKETVCPEGGRQVPPGDVAALAEALDWIAHLPEAERQARGRAGRAHIEAGFTLRAEAEHLSAVIRRLRA